MGGVKRKVVRGHKRCPESSLSHGKTLPVPLDPALLTCWMGWGCPAATMVVTAVGGCTMTPCG